MSLTPLLEAPGTIPLHAFVAMAAFVLGIVQFAAPKGTLPHRTVQPDPSAVDLRAGHAGIGGTARPPAQCQRAQEGDDFDFLWRARYCRPVHLPAGTDHACGGFRPVGESQTGCSGAPPSELENSPSKESCDPRKYMKNRAEKPPPQPASGWFSDPRCAI